MRMWVVGGVLIAMLSGAAHGAENGGSAERPERPHKEAPAPPESKTAPKPEPKKEEPKQTDPPKLRAEPPKTDDKPGKAEEKSTKPEEKPKTEEPASKPEPKAEEPGKKVVASIPITTKLALMEDPSLFPFEIEVEMDGHKAVLSGTVPSDEEKAKAADIARKVEGVEGVVNKLSVSGAVRASWEKRRDELIAHLVKERLNKSETLKAVGFDAKVENGVVTLSGKTRFQVIALEAAEAARQVPGVRAVNTTPVQITAKD